MSTKAFELAKEAYAAVGVDVEAAIATLKKVPVAVHCWQGDDVIGFDNDGALTGGIQTTGNYPGKATTPEQLMADMDKALSLCPGAKKLNVHACYAIFEDGFVDRDKLEPKHFKKWVEFAKERNMGIDFNPTFFSHPMQKDGLTLSHPDKEVRDFWIEHGKACIRISQYFAEETGIPCVMNIWTGDGFKDIPADRLGPRQRYKQSFDEILSEPFDKEKVYPCAESKVFGIGVESYTVGSNEFYQNYAATRVICCLLDTGHYHPTEVVSDKIPSMLAFYDKVQLHVSRPVRWDSDHVVVVDDELKELSKEIIRNDADEKVIVALDYFDASINRLCAWVTGVRSMQKALLSAILQPYAEMKKLQEEANFTKVLYLHERVKFLPFADVWDEYLRRQGLSEDWWEEVEKFEKEVIVNRK